MTELLEENMEEDMVGDRSGGIKDPSSGGPARRPSPVRDCTPGKPRLVPCPWLALVDTEGVSVILYRYVLAADTLDGSACKLMAPPRNMGRPPGEGVEDDAEEEEEEEKAEEGVDAEDDEDGGCAGICSMALFPCDLKRDEAAAVWSAEDSDESANDDDNEEPFGPLIGEVAEKVSPCIGICIIKCGCSVCCCNAIADFVHSVPVPPTEPTDVKEPMDPAPLRWVGLRPPREACGEDSTVEANAEADEEDDEDSGGGVPPVTRV